MVRKQLLILWVGVLCLLSFELHANQQTRVIPTYLVAAKNYQLKDFTLAYLKDPSKQLGIHDVASDQANWGLIASRFIVPKADVNHWFAINLVNDTPVNLKRFVRFDEAYMSQANIFYKREGTWHSEQSGLSQPLENRSLRSRLPSFVIDLAPYETRTVYLQMYSDYYLLTMGIVIEQAEAFLSSEKRYTAGYFFYFGAALSLILYNMCLFLSLREKLYAFYVLHGLSFLVFAFIYSGFDLHVHSSESFRYMLNTSPALALGFFTLFTRELLKTKKNVPVADLMLQVLVGLFFAAAVAIAIDIHHYYWLIVLGVPSTSLLLAVGIYCYKQRLQFSGIYVFGVSWYILGVFLIAGVNIGFIPYGMISRYGYLAGSLVELSVLSFALAYRIKLLQSETLAYQQQILTNEQKATQRLEQQVRERTLALEKANQQLEQQNRIDGLTGLFNRAYFDGALATEWLRAKREQQPLCLIMCDIDHFKDFNDHYGHQQGDVCIQEVAKSLQQFCLRPSDICARYGGEEFIIILPNTSLKSGGQIAERIRQHILEKRIEDQSPQQVVTLSSGVAALIPDAERQPQYLIQLADKALYESKHQGRNRVTLVDQNEEFAVFELR